MAGLRPRFKQTQGPKPGREKVDREIFDFTDSRLIDPPAQSIQNFPTVDPFNVKQPGSPENFYNVVNRDEYFISHSTQESFEEYLPSKDRGNKPVMKIDIDKYQPNFYKQATEPLKEINIENYQPNFYKQFYGEVTKEEYNMFGEPHLKF